MLGIVDAAFPLALAFALGLPLGVERERRPHSAGLRTYPLVTACVCGFLLVARGAGWGVSEQANVFYGVLTGIGFVGSGAVVKSGGSVVGMNTAASLWVAGAIGAGVAYGAPLVSAALSLMCVVGLGGASLMTSRRGTS